MTSRVGGGPRNVPWVGLARPSAVRNFRVAWQVVHALHFDETQGLHNPWNQGKPVCIGRDGQELHPVAGGRLVELMRDAAARALAARGGQPPPPPPALGRQGGGQAAQGKAKKAFDELSFEEYLEAFRAVRRRIRELEEMRGGGGGGEPRRAAGGQQRAQRGGGGGPGGPGGGGGGGGAPNFQPPPPPGPPPGARAGGMPQLLPLGGGPQVIPLQQQMAAVPGPNGMMMLVPVAQLPPGAGGGGGGGGQPALVAAARQLGPDQWVARAGERGGKGRAAPWRVTCCARRLRAPRQRLAPLQNRPPPPPPAQVHRAHAAVRGRGRPPRARRGRAAQLLPLAARERGAARRAGDSHARPRAADDDARRPARRRHAQCSAGVAAEARALSAGARRRRVPPRTPM